MADLRITDLTSLPEGDVAATDVLPIADVSASETKKVTAKDLVEAGVALIDDASIPSAKLAAISPANLGDSSAAAEFIAGPTATTGAFAARTIAPGDLPLATEADAGAVVIGTGLSVTTGTVSAAVATSATLGSVSVPVASGLAVDGAGVLSHQSSVTAQTKNGFTVNSTGHVTAVGSIAATDLPLATTTTVGGIFVGSGLAVTAAGELNHAASIIAGTTSGITYNSSGHITAITALVGNDLPAATAVVKGAVSVPAGALSVDGAGALTHDVSTVTPGSYPKVAVDSRGHVTAGAALAAVDIPELDASKITTGTFPSARLAANSVTADQLADYGIAQVSSTQPVPEFAGQLWINPTDRTAYVWVGQVAPAQGYYLPLNNEFGAQANLRFGGTYNADTNTVASLNTYGAESGLTVGSSLIAPTASSSGVYLLVTTSGTGVSPAPAVALDVGDWILSPGSGTTWTHVNLVGAGISVIDAEDVTFDGSALSPVMSGVADAGAALTTLWGRVQIATLSTIGVVRESTEITVDNSTGAMAVGVVDEGTY